MTVDLGADPAALVPVCFVLMQVFAASGAVPLTVEEDLCLAARKDDTLRLSALLADVRASARRSKGHTQAAATSDASAGTSAGASASGDAGVPSTLQAPPAIFNIPGPNGATLSIICHALLHAASFNCANAACALITALKASMQHTDSLEVGRALGRVVFEAVWSDGDDATIVQQLLDAGAHVEACRFPVPAGKFQLPSTALHALVAEDGVRVNKAGVLLEYFKRQPSSHELAGYLEAYNAAEYTAEELLWKVLPLDSSDRSHAVTLAERIRSEVRSPTLRRCMSCLTIVHVTSPSCNAD